MVSLGSDLAIAACKAVIAAFSGSSAMTAEAVHSMVDCLNSVFLLVGQRSGKKPADRQHPVGHGRDVYFWTLIAAISIFAGGGAASIYAGLVRLVRPRPIEQSIWSYVVLAVAAPFEAWAAAAAYVEHRRMRRERAAGLWETFRAAKDLTTYAVLFENAAAFVGLAIAFFGILGSRLTRTPYPDAVASVAIGALLASVALVLARESRGLIIGESVGPAVEQEIRRIAESHAGVEQVLRVLTVQSGPHDVFLAMNVRFREDLAASSVADVVQSIESRVRAQYPDIRRISIEPDREAPPV